MQGDFLVTTKDYGRVHNPYGSALLVGEKNDGYFALTIPLESVPSPYGDVETFEYNILTEKTKGLTKGKTEATAVTTDFFITKENLYRLDQLKGKVFEYMVVFGNGIGYTFNGELDYRFNDVDNGDNLKGSLTVTPSSVGDTIYDVRPFIRQTLMFSGTLPASVTLTSENATGGLVLECAIENGSTTATITPKLVGDASSKYNVAWDNTTSKLTIKQADGATLAEPSYCMVQLTASDTATMDGSDKLKYAPYTLIIDLDYQAIAS